MIWTSSEVVAVLTFLLPGFVSAGVFYSLTSHPKPNDFGSVIQALIFTLVVQSIVISLRFTVLDTWQEPELDVLVSVLIAVTIGLIAACISNHDAIHQLLRFANITRETSYASEWYSAFARRENYVVLHMSGGRRLYGWPTEWPSNPDRGHFRITDGEWLTKNGCETGQASSNATTAIEFLIPVSEVEMVQFVSTDTVKETD